MSYVLIDATDAMRLPGAQITEDELREADMLTADLHKYIVKYAERRGFEWQANTGKANVISEIMYRLRVAKWTPQITGVDQDEPLVRGGKPRILRYYLAVAPSDEAVTLARTTSASLD
jgi:hypothetical protein